MCAKQRPEPIQDEYDFSENINRHLFQLLCHICGTDDVEILRASRREYRVAAEIIPQNRHGTSDW